MDTTIAESARPTSPLRQTRERVSADSQATERERGDKKGKRVQQMLKNQVHKQSARIGTISKKIGHGVARGGLHRSTSAPGQHVLVFCALPGFNFLN